MPIKLPTVQTGFEQSIDKAAKKAGKNLKINMGPGAKSIEGLTRPLGRLTGKADEFTKSMEAANARVLAFGASVGVIAAVSNALKELVTTTIQVEKSLANINSILKQSDSQLDGFKKQIFDIARNTGQTFDVVAEAALELSRQGLKAEEVTKRLNDALVLSRLSGLSASDAVAGLTAAVNSFSSAGLTTTDVLNKISAAAASAAVSDRDLIEGLKRSGAVAVASGVQFDELIGIISALQEKTARGGSVIGNSLKTIFTRIQDIEKLQTLQDLGVQVTDLEGKVLSSSKVIENLAPVFAKMSQASKVNLADNLVGKFQIAPFLALLEDFNQKISRSGEVATTSFNATNEAYERNTVLNNTLATAINTATVNLKELANALGEIGVTENLSKIIGVFNDVVSKISGVLDGDGMGSDFAKGLIKGISAVIAGPGLALALVAIGKLLLDFAKFGAGALKTFFGLNRAAEAQKNLQGQIAASLLNDKGIRDAILSIEKQNISAGEKKKLQTQFFTKALNEQLMVMQKMQGIASTIAPGVMAGTASKRGGRAAGGFLPIGAERSDISKGVGGAPASAKPVIIPNFAFGGGKRGTMVANDSEYIVPNYANGGDAIFNQNMASSMGLPSNARKVRAAGGYIPNFATSKGGTKMVNSRSTYVMLHGEHGKTDPQKIAYYHPESNKYNVTDAEGAIPIKVPIYGLSDNHKGSNVNDYIKNLEDHAAKEAIKSAFELGGGQMPNPAPREAAIKKQVNSGAVAGFAGSIYELALAALLTDEEFTKHADQTATSNFDLNLQGQTGLLDLYNISTKPKFGEVKGRMNSDNVASAAAKIGRVNGLGGKPKQAAQQGRLLGKRLPVATAREFGITPSNKSFHTISASDLDKINANTPNGQKASFSGGKNPMFQGFVRGASGYIPNFADPLQDAIGRERSAGLPVSQIRINQSGKLRNAQNPMGLAVTNTRDEPTGAIPNFAGGETGEVSLSLKDVGSSAKGLKSELDNLNRLINSLNVEIRNGQTSHADAGKQIDDFSKKVSNSKKSQEKIQSAAKAELAVNEEKTKSHKNYLGVMFGLQAGMTALNAATEGSTGAIGKYTSIVSDGIAGVSGFAFAGQAAQELGDSMSGAGGLKGAIGGLVGKLGVAGSVIGGAMEVFDLGKELYNEYSGANKRASDALTALKDRADDLSFAFSQLSEVEKAKATGDAEDVLSRRGPSEEIKTTGGIFNSRPMTVEEAKSINKSTESMALIGRKTFDINEETGEVRLLKERTFENDDLKKGFATTIAQLRATEMPLEEIDDILDGFKSFLDGKELGQLADIVVKRNKELRVVQKEFSKFVSGLSDEEFDQMVGSKSFIRESLGGSKDKTPELKNFLAKINPSTVQKLLEQETKGRDQKTADQGKAVDQLTLTASKARIATALELKKLDIDSNKQAQKRLEKAQQLGIVDKVALQDLKAKAELEKMSNDFAKERVDFLAKEGEKLTNLGVKREDVDNFKEALKGLSTKDITEEGAEGYRKILREILKIGDANDDQVNQAIKALEAQMKGQDALNEKKKKGLENDLESEKTIARILEVVRKVKSEAELSKLRIDTKGAQEQFTFDQDKRALQRSTPGTSNPFQRSVGRQIAQIDLDAAKALAATNTEKFQQDFLVKSAELGKLSVAAKSGDPEAVKARDILANEMALMPQQLKTANAQLMANAQANKDAADAVGTITDAATVFINIVDGLEQQRQNAMGQANFDAAQLGVMGLTKRANRKLAERAAIDNNPDLTPANALEKARLERDFQGRMKLRTKDDAVINSDFLDSMVDASVQFRDNFAAAFAEGIKSVDDLEDALLNVANQFLQSMTKNLTQKFMDQTASEGGGKGLFGLGIGIFANGGPVRGGSGSRDDVPAMLMGGEFVMNKKAVQRYGSGFMEAINSGSIRGFARGGQVRDEEGMFTTPGMNGAGAIVGMQNLMSFATQTPTALGRDKLRSEGAFLDAESGRFTMFGRRNNPQFQKVQDAKRQALGLAGQEVDARKQAKEQQVSLGDMLMSAAISTIVSFGASKALGKLKGADDKPLIGKGMRGLLSSGAGNLAGVLTTGAPASGGAFGAAAASGDLRKIFSGGKSKTSGNAGGNNGVGNNGGYIKRGVLPQHGLMNLGFTDKELNVGVLNRATGGLIPAAGGVDTVPAMLSGGEFVMNAAATRNIGAGNLQALNSGVGAGDNTDLVSKLDELITATETSQSTGDINITINGSNGTESQTGGEDAPERERKLSERIKVAVKQVIADEQRLGGQLRK
jgi:TP901 family phage tail tape measure protein